MKSEWRSGGLNRITFSTGRLDRTRSASTMAASRTIAHPTRTRGGSTFSDSIDRDTISPTSAPSRTWPGEKPVSKIHIANSDSASSGRSEDNTSELPSLMRLSYAVLCLNKKTTKQTDTTKHQKIKHINTKLL